MLRRTSLRPRLRLWVKRLDVVVQFWKKNWMGGAADICGRTSFESAFEELYVHETDGAVWKSYYRGLNFDTKIF